MPNDSCDSKLETTGVDAVDLGQTHVLVRIPFADLSPRERFGFDRYKLFGGVHASILPGCGGMSSFRLITQLRSSVAARQPWYPIHFRVEIGVSFVLDVSVVVVVARSRSRAVQCTLVARADPAITRAAIPVERKPHIVVRVRTRWIARRYAFVFENQIAVATVAITYVASAERAVRVTEIATPASTSMPPQVLDRSLGDGHTTRQQVFARRILFFVVAWRPHPLAKLVHVTKRVRPILQVSRPRHVVEQSTLL